MHESGLTRALVREIVRAAAREGATKVVRAKVRIGALAGISPDHLREHFIIAARGSVAEDASLEVEMAAEDQEPHANGILLETLEFASASSELAKI